MEEGPRYTLLVLLTLLTLLTVMTTRAPTVPIIRNEQGSKEKSSKGNK